MPDIIDALEALPDDYPLADVRIVQYAGGYVAAHPDHPAMIYLPGEGGWAWREIKPIPEDPEDVPSNP